MLFRKYKLIKKTGHVTNTKWANETNRLVLKNVKVSFVGQRGAHGQNCRLASVQLTPPAGLQAKCKLLEGTEAQSETSSTFQRKRKLLLPRILREPFVNPDTSVLSSRINVTTMDDMKIGSKYTSDVPDTDLGSAGRVPQFWFLCDKCTSCAAGRGVHCQSPEQMLRQFPEATSHAQLAKVGITLSN